MERRELVTRQVHVGMAKWLSKKARFESWASREKCLSHHSILQSRTVCGTTRTVHMNTTLLEKIDGKKGRLSCERSRRQSSVHIEMMMAV